jgi:glycosyltransferase involved in cell wall biosynthesis
MDKDLHLIHNGIDLKNRPDISKRLALRKKLNLPLDKKIVLFVANGGKDNIWKGWNYAKQVFNSFVEKSEVLFLCLGGKAEQEKPKNVLFVDYVADKSLLAEYFAAADVFLLSSTAESFALVVLEAMAAGLPVVSFSVGVIPEVIEHKVNGYVAGYLDADDLARGLDYILSLGQDDLKNIAQTNVHLVTEEFTVEKMAERYLALFTKIVK